MIPAARIRLRAAAAGLVLGMAVVAAACSSPASAPPSVAPPGCHTSAATIRLVLSDRSPVPVVRVPPGGCVAVSVPRSPFRHAEAGPTRTAPSGRLRLVSDSLLADGTRVAFYLASGTGTATITSTVSVHTGRSVPQWSGLVVVV